MFLTRPCWINTCSDPDAGKYKPDLLNHLKESIKILLYFNINVNAVNNNQSTALHLAAYDCYGDTEILEALKNKGASLEMKNRYGATPLGSYTYRVRLNNEEESKAVVDLLTK